MMNARVLFLIAIAILCLPVAPAFAITSGDPSTWGTPTGDPDVDAGTAAFEREDWPGVVESMSKAVERRPWDDVAHTLLGFAYRKLERYDLSLAHYDKALALNPHNRGALEYLGEAYLEIARPDDARATLVRLEAECRRVTDANDGDWQAECEEWGELKAAYDAYLARTGTATR